MGDRDWLSERFRAQRTRLVGVAYRMLGSSTEAEDAVQEAWIRVSRADSQDVENLGGWLTTVVARICLDMLRSRKSRREVAMPEQRAREAADVGPEEELLLADALGPALMVVLDTLAPAERVAFVLHDTFGVSFEEIGGILGRTPTASRQLASRARRRVQGAAGGLDDRAREREVVDAFLAASRNGDFEALLAVLAPDVVLHADDTAVRTAAANKWAGTDLPSEVRGARAVAELFKGRAQGARRATIDGAAGAVWAPGGAPRSAFVFEVEGDRVVAIHLIMDPEPLAALDVELL